VKVLKPPVRKVQGGEKKENGETPGHPCSAKIKVRTAGVEIQENIGLRRLARVTKEGANVERGARTPGERPIRPILTLTTN